MDKDRVFWGVCFILGAVLLILNQVLAGFDFSLFKIFIIIICAAVIIRCIPSMNFWGILLPLALIYSVLDIDYFLGISKSAVWGSAILGSVGLEILLKNQKRNFWEDKSINSAQNHKYTSGSGDNVAGERIHIENVFGNSTKYVSSDNFLFTKIDNSFGAIAVYFDNALIQNSSADIKIDNAFGTINLYVPKNWKVNNNVTVSFGAFKEHGKNQISDFPILNIYGSTAFGTVNVYYI